MKIYKQKNFFVIKASLPWEWYGIFDEILNYKLFSLPPFITINHHLLLLTKWAERVCVGYLAYIFSIPDCSIGQFKHFLLSFLNKECFALQDMKGVMFKWTNLKYRPLKFDSILELFTCENFIWILLNQITHNLI